jgi:hypothetical protein
LDPSLTAGKTLQQLSLKTEWSERVSFLTEALSVSERTNDLLDLFPDANGRCKSFDVLHLECAMVFCLGSSNSIDVPLLEVG